MNENLLLNKILSDCSYGLCPPPTSDADTIKILTEYLLGPNWYTTMTISKEQVNTEIICAVLYKFPKKKPKKWNFKSPFKFLHSLRKVVNNI
jgi:hypothetical protein